ncbi:YceD family protein [Lederbergia citrea]|uniref:DUF177 domain-containing protein n=1 Tax=Lederbergia citrea TaxID=2833581 RepID=A0A942ULM3_9BACI|nr:YceD family protein [Lederbergia citrea]MBS4203893.1 DUF177 domain-containing protein [Lederbergia citrea]MBS4221522.1 DUF177 domain-containing protein [Lederbergia citrea]
MKWTVIQLQKFRNNAMKIDDYIEVAADLRQRDPEIRGASPIHVTGKADIDSQKVTFHLHLTGTLILPCSRTLADVEYPINIRSIETFMLKPLEYDLEELEEIHDVQGGIIDLMPIIQELLLLEVPMQVYCEAEITDPALQTGKDWEVMTEEQFELEQQQQKKKVDPRLAGLAELLKSDEE